MDYLDTVSLQQLIDSSRLRGASANPAPHLA
jgi:hypothetical protein